MPTLHISNDLKNLLKTELKSYIVDMIYPVGSIFMSIVNTNPQTYLGGTWVAWGTGRVPVGVDTNQSSFNSVEKTGGENSHTLTINEMPSHAHYTSNYHGGGKTQNNATTNAGVHGDQNYWNFYNAGLSNYVGSGWAHNNLQPYITCYMWKRTA